MKTTAISLISLVILAACGSAPLPSPTPPEQPPPPAPVVGDIEGGRTLVGPFAGWEEICGTGPTLPSPGESARIHERCTVTLLKELDGADGLLEMATFIEGMDGAAYLGLRTDAGWYVTMIPDGEPFGGGLSHHTPASTWHDAAHSRVAGGALEIVVRHASSSLIPGMGSLGSSRHESTAIQRCGLRDGVPVCGEPEVVYRRDCQRPMDGGEPTCEDSGTDV